MVNLSFKEINDLYTLFQPLYSVFDIDALTKEYIFIDNLTLLCISCKRTFSNPYEVCMNIECKGESYAPISKNSERDRSNDSLQKKGQNENLIKNEGKHIIVIQN
jgi:hypothetical protein